jgi:multidrug efflux pump
MVAAAVSAIAGGLAFATLLTLILTPCMLVLGDRISLTYRQLAKTQAHTVKEL